MFELIAEIKILDYCIDVVLSGALMLCCLSGALMLCCLSGELML